MELLAAAGQRARGGAGFLRMEKTLRGVLDRRASQA
jgi:hypothetical protein